MKQVTLTGEKKDIFSCSECYWIGTETSDDGYCPMCNNPWIESDED